MWGARYPGIIRLWDNAWAEFVPFLAFELEVRKVIFSTNAIESLNARFRLQLSALAATSRTSKRRSNASTSRFDRLTPPVAAGNDGPYDGSQH